jgi:FMN phosphatase YigB (HAD superfamily)
MKGINYKLAIFDLDGTLWNGKELFTDTISILTILRNLDVKLYIASFHQDAYNCCIRLGIAHFFEDIIYGRGRSKFNMIESIMKLTNITGDEIIFFDDILHNIRDVQKNSNITSILVGSSGINLQYLDCVHNSYTNLNSYTNSNSNITMYTSSVKRYNNDKKDNNLITNDKKDIFNFSASMLSDEHFYFSDGSTCDGCLIN